MIELLQSKNVHIACFQLVRRYRNEAIHNHGHRFNAEKVKTMTDTTRDIERKLK